LGHPCKFQRVSHLGSVTARHSSIGHQPNFAALNRGRHLYSAGRPSRWALAHILVVFLRLLLIFRDKFFTACNCVLVNSRHTDEMTHLQLLESHCLPLLTCGIYAFCLHKSDLADVNIHCVSEKNVTTLSCYNFNVHELILIIFGRNITKKVSNQEMFYFPSHLASAF